MVEVVVVNIKNSELSTENIQMKRGVYATSPILLVPLTLSINLYCHG